MKQNSKTSLSVAILLAATMAATAAHSADSGFFAELGVGMTKSDTGIDNVSGVSIDDNDVFFSVGGGYSFNKMFALEAGYTDLGEVEVSAPALAYTATISADGFYFGPRLTFELAPNVEVYGRLGMFAWDVEAKDSLGTSIKEDGTDIYFGIGAAYKISDQVSLGAEWTRFTAESDGDDADMDTFGAKLKFNF